MHGGRRIGAGRKRGVQNKVNEELRQKLTERGTLPLAYMLELMRDEAEDQAVRRDMAKSAAPYLHPRVQSITLPVDDDQEPRHVVRVEFVKPKPRNWEQASSGQGIAELPSEFKGVPIP